MRQRPGHVLEPLAAVEPLAHRVHRLRQVAELLRRSQVPLLMFSTGEDSLQQLRRELGRLAEVAR